MHWLSLENALDWTNTKIIKIIASKKKRKKRSGRKKYEEKGDMFQYQSHENRNKPNGNSRKLKIVFVFNK